MKKGSVGKKNPDLFKMSLFGQGLSEDSERRGYNSSQCEVAAVGTMLCLGDRQTRAAWHMSPKAGLQGTGTSSQERELERLQLQ